MTLAAAGLLFVIVLGGLAAIGVKAWRGRAGHEEAAGNEIDLIPYLLLALAVGVAGFSLARLARVSLTPDRFAGRPASEIAAALAGLVVAAPVAYFLWRRQAKRRKVFPETPGWPIYLAAVELVFLGAFFVSVGQIADALGNSTVTPEWPNLIVYGGIVAFHWWAERRESALGDTGELPRLIGSGVSGIALTGGAIGTLTWLFSEAYESLGTTISVPDPAIPLALTLVGAPVWAYRWLPAWHDEPAVFRNLYLSVVTALSLIAAIGAAVTLVAVLLAFILGQAGPASGHFDIYPPALAVAVVGGALWIHHRRRLGVGRTGALRGYEYAMAAAGLGGLVGSAVALINLVFAQRLAGSNTGEGLIALGCSVIAAGGVWFWFWGKVQAAPREDEIRALQRRIYLLGMSVILGLTATGALIAALVVLFRALLGEGGGTADSLRIPLSLTAVSGIAAWQLFTQVREDNLGLKRIEVRPFLVTLICSHPGNITTMFPREATTRVIYRADASGIIDEQMAAAIVAEIGNRSSVVWVDEAGYKIALARES